MSAENRKLLNEHTWDYSHLNERCASTDGASYYSCADTDTSSSESDDNGRKRSQTLYHSLSWEFVTSSNDEASTNTVSYDPQSALSSLTQDDGHVTDTNGNNAFTVSAFFKCLFILFLCLITMGKYCSVVQFAVINYDTDLHNTSVFWTFYHTIL